MSTTTARRIAAAVTGAIVVFLLGHFILGISTGSLSDQGALTDVFSAISLLLFSAVLVIIGWTIVTRQPSNTIGWLLLAIPFIAAVAFFVGDYATEALVMHPGSFPLGRFAAWVDRWAIVPTLVIFIPIFLLFPDGLVPSRRWRPVLWLTVLAPTVTIVSFALTPGRLTGAFADLTSVRVTNPFGLTALGGPMKTLTEAGGFACFGAAILAGAAIVTRYRGATTEVRQQIRWLAFVGVAFLVEVLVGIVLNIAFGDVDAIGNALFIVWSVTLLLGIPFACSIAILKYRLYDLDVVVRKAVVFGAMAIFIAIVYAAIVGGAGALVGSASGPVLSFAAAATLAVLFQPARERAHRLADKLVYGKRATPYEVLAEFSGRVGEAYATEDVLPRMAQLLVDGTGAASGTVWLRVGAQLRPEASWPAGTGSAPVALAGDSLPSLAGEHATEVRDRGELLGALTVVMPAADPMDPTKEKLVRDLAGQAGLVLRNVRLIEELRASRQRLVAAQDEERRKLERNLHDGAQQQLVAISVQLKLLEQLAGRDAEKERELASRLQQAASDAIEELREIARGIYPPLLADQGLAAALESQARKAAVPTTIETAGIGRYTREVEAAVYFSALEALTNVAKYANASRAVVRLSRSNGHLRLEVHDDGVGFDPSATGYGTGLQGMADRLAAVGGDVVVESSPGSGTTVSGRVPVEGDG
jgi:signal transduction histidine kinase